MSHHKEDIGGRPGMGLMNVRGLYVVGNIPVVDEWRQPCGRVCRLEVSGHRYQDVAPEYLLSGLSRAEQLRLLIWLFTRCSRSGRDGEGEVRIAISSGLAVLCLRSLPLQELLSGGGLSLELTGTGHRTLIAHARQLGTLCPVWLGGLGLSGATPVMMTSGVFTGGVIPVDVTRVMQATDAGISLLRALVTYCRAHGCRVVMQGDFGVLLRRLGGAGVSGFEQAERGMVFPERESLVPE